MEAVGRTWRIRVGLGLLAAVTGGLGLWSLRPAAAPSTVSLRHATLHRVVAGPIVDFERLYSVDHLALDADPILDLRTAAPVGAGPPQLPVPEPAPLWILGFAALYTLYLPARSW